MNKEGAEEKREGRRDFKCQLFLIGLSVCF